MKCVIKSTLSHMHVGPGHCLEIIPPYSRSFYYKSSHPILLQILYLYLLLAVSILLAPLAGLEIIPPYSRAFIQKSSHAILLQILYLYFLLAASILLAPPAGLDIIPLYVLDPLFTNHPTLFYCKSFICIFCWLFPSFLQLLLVQILSHPTLEPLFTNHPTLFQILYICIFCWQLPSCWHLPAGYYHPC